MEDNEINQELAVELLEGNGLKVTLARDGKEALRVLSQGQFDGVLMDCQMPVMDGYTATRKIREDDRYKDLPVIAMTANAMAGDRDKVLQAGMNDHIAKPVNVTDMFKIMAKWITAAAPATDRAKERPGSPGEPDLEPFPDLPGIDTNDGLARTQKNRRLYRKLLRRFWDNYKDFAGTFEAALMEADSGSAERCAHTLKANAATLGAKQVSLVAGELEQACAQSLEYEPALKATLQALQEVIQGLGEYIAQQDHAAISVLPDNFTQPNESLYPLLDKLSALLAEYDTSALDLMEDIEAAMGVSHYKTDINEMARAIEAYDFELAADKLAALRKLL